MKSMTCKDLGGPCDLAFHGEDANEIIKAQDQHLKELAQAGDQAHLPARDHMKRRWRHPMKSMNWYNEIKRQFAELPEG